MRAWILCLLLVSGCDEWAEPSYVAHPPPPSDGVASRDMKIAEGTAGGILFHHIDRSRADGNGAYLDDIRVHDESILRVIQSTRDAALDYEEGHAFVIIGLRAGQTDVDCYSGREKLDTIHVTVVPQD